MSVTSEYYMARASESALEADRATLENVRERHLRSEAAWLAMARRLTRTEAMRAAHAVRMDERGI